MIKKLFQFINKNIFPPGQKDFESNVYEFDDPDEDYWIVKFKEIPVELFPKIKVIFDDNLAWTFIDQAKNMIAHDGLHNWMIPYHFSTGMKIRNLLRDNGIVDDMMPDQNLDDYYILMLEWWLGYRDNNGNSTI